MVKGMDCKFDCIHHSKSDILGDRIHVGSCQKCKRNDNYHDYYISKDIKGVKYIRMAYGIMPSLKDFPIIFSYWCENITKENGVYNLTIKDWKYRSINHGIFNIYAKNKQELIHKILKIGRKEGW